MALALTIEGLLSSSTDGSGASASTTLTFLAKPPTNLHSKIPPLKVSFPSKKPNHNLYSPISVSSSSNSRAVRGEITSTSTSSTSPFGKYSTNYDSRHWMVLLETPPPELTSKSEIIDYYISKIERVLSSKKDAQKCLYDVSCATHFGFCCEIDEEKAHELANIPGVLSVKPDPDIESTPKDYSSLKIDIDSTRKNYTSLKIDGLSTESSRSSTLSFAAGTSKHWLVRMDRRAVEATQKAQVVDYYVKVLMKVLLNKKDAQMCIYHVSCESNYGFCCILDDKCAQALADVPGVLSVKPDEKFELDDKDYGDENSSVSTSNLTSNINTKKLFVTGLSFYTSEKTLRAAFEGYGKLVEVKIIMDKISMRSKGYAFIEYTTEEAARAALREMNGQIINGWTIIVDAARNSPPKY